MDKKSLWIAAVVFLALMGWQKFYLEPRAAKSVATASQTQAHSGGLAAPAVASASFENREVPLGASGKDHVKLSVGPRWIADWDIEKGASLAALSENDPGPQVFFDSQELVASHELSGKFESQGSKWVGEDARVQLEREWKPSVDGSGLEWVIRGKFKTAPPKHVFLSLSAKTNPSHTEAEDRSLVFWANQEIRRVSLKELSKAEEVVGAVKWIGLTSRYFVFSMVNRSPEQPWVLVQPVGQDQSRVSLVYPVSGNQFEIRVTTTFTPKELNLLRSIEPTLDHTVDFGFFTFFAYPILRFLKWLNTFFNNFGIAIIALTLVLKLVTFPLTYKSVKSMKHMAKIQPQIEKLKERYKDDKESLNKEMLTLMRTQGYNPMAGCLPVLAQIPIFFALNRVLYVAVELYQAPFLLWIRDLSVKDPYYVTPVVLTALMYFQQRLMPPTPSADPMQQKMMQWMPVLFGVFMVSLPAGLTLYMLVNSLASIVQQLVLNKKFETPSLAKGLVTRA